MSLFQELLYENSTNEEAYPVSTNFDLWNFIVVSKRWPKRF